METAGHPPCLPVLATWKAIGVLIEARSALGMAMPPTSIGKQSRKERSEAPEISEGEEEQGEGRHVRWIGTELRALVPGFFIDLRWISREIRNWDIDLITIGELAFTRISLMTCWGKHITQTQGSRSMSTSITRPSLPAEREDLLAHACRSYYKV